jgi:transposase-like protein
MPMNRIQFQPGVSMPEFFARYGSEDQCAAALRAMRWPDGFRCPRCDSAEHYVVGHGARRLFQCQGCRHQTSLTAGTVLDSTKLPLRTWFLAIYLVSQDKTGLSSLALMRHLGTTYRTAWLVHHKLMAAMAELSTAREPLARHRATRRRLPWRRTSLAWVAAVRPTRCPSSRRCRPTTQGHPLRVKVSPIGHLQPRSHRQMGPQQLAARHRRAQRRLACFAGVIDAGCAHSYIVVASRKPRELPQFTWVNTILGNLKTMINGGYKAFKFGKYANHYLGAFAYRFNHRVNLKSLLQCLIGNAATCSPTRERQIRREAVVHD